MFLLLLLVIVLTCLTVVGDSQFVPRPQQVHFGRQTYPRRWGRWCTEDIDCGRGFCQAYMCQCYRGHITWYFMESCSYEQRTKLAAFLVSFFVGFLGVDWFLLSRGNAGYIVAGIIKLIISMACGIGWPMVFVNASKKQPKKGRHCQYSQRHPDGDVRHLVVDRLDSSVG